MKLFAVSDIHGFYDPLIAALDAAGFEKNNPQHLLVCCGDYFDRGRQPKEVLKFLKSVENKVLIRGNHEDLFERMVARGYPGTHDYSNGTVQTVYDMIGKQMHQRYYDEAVSTTHALVKDLLDSMVPYFETEHYVFTHAFLPVTEGFGFILPDWRHAHSREWSDARWVNPMKAIRYCDPIEKTIVSGHWHASYGHAIEDGTPEFGDVANHTPYYTDGLIAIDACTAASGFTNVVVLEDDLLAG